MLSFAFPPWPQYLISSYRRFEPDEKHITRIYNVYVLLFILENTLRFTENGLDVELSAGEWYIQAPSHQSGPIGSPAPFYYFLHFEAVGEASHENAGIHTLAPNIHNEAGRFRLVLPRRGTFDVRHFKAYFDELEYLRAVRADPFGAQPVFLTILDQLAAVARMAMLEPTNFSKSILDYLTANFDNRVGSEDLERRFHYSADYVSRLLKLHHNTTPAQYVQMLRINRAMELLANTDDSIPQVARQVGYRDASIFYKAFCKRIGMAPSIWRRQSRGLAFP